MSICISSEGLDYLTKFPDYMAYWNKRKGHKEKKYELIKEFKEQGRLEKRI
ncbi:hypothetical protein [Clostridium manihotivorum]|uniref:hypothetical protein n=1 Tax=Clostridium manihotivorum TaxID=2320868 RepID=UPI0013E4075A|nr:hypothetical protein [Clostridium manihotivorum]